MARFRNVSSSAIFSAVTLQAAVPKSQKLQLQGISQSEMGPGASASQQMRVVSVSGGPPAKLRLRLKIVYSMGGQPVTEQVDWSEQV